MSLVQAAPEGGLEPALVVEGKGLTAWIGSCETGPLAELQQSRSGFWLLDLSELPEPPSPTAMGLPGARWGKLRSRAGVSICEDLASDDYAALLSTAAGLAAWHRSVRFCALCGGQTEPYRAGTNRRCVACGARFRPRLDPAMIVLVTHRNRCLLGRKAAWPPGRFSALAGFVEFGETLGGVYRA